MFYFLLMNKLKIFVIGLVCATIFSCAKSSMRPLYRSPNLVIKPMTKNTLVHVSYLNTKQWSKVACNGMIYINNGEAIVFDTPTDSAATHELLKWLSARATIKGVVVNHFHEDCLGGLRNFHQANIPSYSSNKTIQLATKAKVTVPQSGFDTLLTLQVGHNEVLNRYFGAGHTQDNIVSYLPNEKAMFGGCLIKSLNASKGYLGDADTLAWSNTVRKVKQAFPEVQYVVPGHGNFGNSDLLDYTINLFLRQ